MLFINIVHHNLTCLLSQVEEQRLNKEACAAETAALKKVEKVRAEQDRLIEGLSSAQESFEKQARLLEIHAEDVDKAVLVINSALSSGMGWEDIAEMVQEEKDRRNPIALLVSKLRLDRNHVVLALSNPYSDDEGDGGGAGDEDSDSDSNNDSNSDSDSDSGGQAKGRKKSAKKASSKPPLKEKKKKYTEVEIDLDLSAYNNASKLFTHKKAARVKEEKTITHSARVMKSVEDSTMKALEKQKLKKTLQAARKVLWFEKFNWFITSEG